MYSRRNQSTSTSLILNPMRSLKKFSCLAVPMAFAAAGLCAPTVWAQDKIYPLAGGASSNGKIVERTKDKVVIEVRGVNQSFDTNLIGRLLFDGEPPQLSRVKGFILEGQLDQAIEEFKKIDASTVNKPDEIRQDYNFFKGYLAALNALRGKGDAANASKLLLSWASENRSSHLFYTASEKLGELAMASGAPDAERYFGVLAAAPFVEFKIKGNYLSGKALLTNKKPTEAKAKFAAVTQIQVADPVSLKFKKLASLGTIQCDAAEGKTTQAIEAIEKMVDEGDSTDAELFSELFNTLGGILQAAGKNEEAVLSYLKTDLLYASEPDAHAEALFHLTQLWPLIGENQRATEAKSRLSKLYPTSLWLKK